MQGGVKLRVIGVLVAGALIAPATIGGVCAAAQAPFIAPSSGPIVREYQPPLGPYGPGHRGVDYAVPSGTPFWASGDGTVTFAGPVADDGLFITVDHGMEIATTYSFLSQIDVTAGQKIKQGDIIGLTGDGHPGEGVPALHFGAKVAGMYVDPELLLKSTFGNVHLVALDQPEEDIEVIYRDGQEGSILSPAEPIRARPIAGPAGIIAAIGKRIESAGKAVVRFPGKVVEWGRNRIDDGRRAWNKAREFARTTGDWFSAGWDRVAKFAKNGGRAAKDFFENVSRKVRSSWDGLSKWLRGVGGRIASVAEKGREWFWKVVSKAKALKEGVSKIAGKVKTLYRKALKLLTKLKFAITAVLTAFHLGRGVIEQIGCSLRGGGTPPPIPSKEEMALGADAPPPPNDNIVVAVAGIGSHTDELSDGKIKAAASMYNMDLRTLGYSEDSIFHYSYKGIEEREGQGPYRLHAPYTREDTYQSLRDAAGLLARQVEEIHKLYPKKEIDIVAHSQGGLVAQYYLAALYQPKRLESPQVDHFVAIATPHGGADAAQLHRQIAGSEYGDFLLEGWDELSRMTGLPRPSSAAVQEMAEDSTFLTELDRLWNPEKVETTTIAATFDYVVTAPHTHLKGATHFTANLPTTFGSIFNAHGDVVEANNTKQIIYGALSDDPVACTAFRDAVADHGIGNAISTVEDVFFDAYGLVVRHS